MSSEETTKGQLRTGKTNPFVHYKGYEIRLAQEEQPKAYFIGDVTYNGKIVEDEFEKIGLTFAQIQDEEFKTKKEAVIHIKYLINKLRSVKNGGR